MKQCPTCNRTYRDDTLSFCLDDGTPLTARYDPEETLVNPTRTAGPASQRRTAMFAYVIIGLLALTIGGGAVALFRSGTRDAPIGNSPSNVASTSATKSPSQQRPSPRSKDAPLDYWDGSVSANDSGGVRAESSSGRRLEVNAGDEIEVKTRGTVKVGADMPAVGPQGQPDYRDPYVDSPYHDHVGGLEMWIGPDRSANRYFVGSYFRQTIEHTGVITFRVIDVLNGYENNTGAFQVTVKKIAR